MNQTIKYLSRISLTEVCLYLLILCLPFQLGTFFFIEESFVFGIRTDYLAPALYLTDILAFMLILLRFKHIGKANKAVYIFILLIINSVLAYEPIVSFYRLIKYIELFLLYRSISSIKINMYYVATCLIFSTSLQVVLCSLQFIYGSSLQGMWYYAGERLFTMATPGIAKMSWDGKEFLRSYGTFSHPNALGGFYALIVVWTPIALQKEGQIRKVLLQSLALFLVIISFSKNAFMGFFVASLPSVLSFKKKCVLCVIAKISMMVVVASLVLGASGDPASTTKRWYLIKSAISIIQQHLWFGVGPGNYLYAQSWIPHPFPYHFLEPVHNIFLLFIAEAGLVASCVGLFLWRKVIRNLLTGEARYLVLVIVITGMFDHYWLTQQQNMLLIPVLFGLLQRRVV